MAEVISQQQQHGPSSPLWWLVSLGCVNQNALDLRGNVRRIKGLIEQCRRVGSQFLCLPELAVSGYGCEDMFGSAHFCQQVEVAMGELVAATANFSLVVGAPMQHNNQTYNAIFLVQNQQIVAITAKKILAEGEVYYESRWFRPWPAGAVEFVAYAGSSGVPFGDPWLQVGEMSMGVEICEEAWSERRPLRYAPPCEVVFHLSASYFAIGKHKRRQELVVRSSELFQGHYLYVNLLGVDSAKLIYDGGSLWAYRGELIHESPRLSLYDAVLTHHHLKLHPQNGEGQGSPARPVVRVDAEVAGLRRTQVVVQAASAAVLTLAAQPQQLVYQQYQSHDQHPRATEVSGPPLGGLAYELGGCDDETFREFFAGLTLGLWDYLRKSSAQCYVISLSGGCDSSAVACLVVGMFRRVCQELGEAQLAQRLGWPQSQWDEVTSPAPALAGAVGWLARLVRCVYQRTTQSSAASAAAAAALCDELGIPLEVISIQQQVDAYIAQLEHRLQRKLSWEEDMSVLENIQARARSPYPWMLANTFGGIVLCTANRSEAAVGYTTMDGDSSGGLAPVSGVSKAWLQRWLRWVSDGGLEGYMTGAALHQVLAYPPTAELRPARFAQTDEQDLMPYEVMAQIETLFVLEQCSEAEVVRRLQQTFDQLKEADLQAYVRTFYELWQSSQWKRERLAAGFHVAEMNVDPQSWYRYPILSTRTEVS